MDHIRGTVAFVTAAREGSFTRAARTLDLSPQAVAAGVARLEESLGVRLFNRTTRSIALTEEGQAFLHHAQAGLATLDEAVHALRDRADAPSGLVRVTTGAAFARRYLLRLLPEFSKSYPDVRLDLLPGPRAKGTLKTALHTAERFVINSTLGLGGLFDVAKRKPFHLAPHGNGMANTLGYYGADAGPYLYLPVLGPTTLRDMIGNVADAFTEPLVLNRVSRKQVVQTKRRQVTIFSSSVELSTPGAVAVVVGGLDHRAEADAEWEALRHQSIDAYAALRSSYLQNRAGEIAALHPGKPGAPAELDDPLADPAAQPAPATEPPPGSGK